MQPATSAAPSSLEHFARGRPKLRSPRSPSRTLPVGAARAAGACWRPLWPQRKGGAVWRVKAANRCIGYLRYLMRALPSPVVRNGGGDPAALVGPCCCCKAQILLLLCDASCHLPKCGVWVQPIGLRSLRGVHARARPSPRRQRSAENLPFSHSLKWQLRTLEHGQNFHIFREHSGRQRQAIADPVQNLRFQVFPRFRGVLLTDSRERYLKGSPGAARARSKPAGP